MAFKDAGFADFRWVEFSLSLTERRNPIRDDNKNRLLDDAFWASRNPR